MDVLYSRYVIWCVLSVYEWTCCTHAMRSGVFRVFMNGRVVLALCDLVCSECL